MRRRVVGGLAVVGIVWSLAACGGGNGDGWGTSDPPPRPGSVHAAHRPPAVPRTAPGAFHRTASATVEGGFRGNPPGDPANRRVTLGGLLAYAYDDASDDGITAYDLASGDVAWQETYPADSHGGTPAPVLASASVLIGVSATATDHSPDAPAHHTITAVAYEAGTGYPLWATAFDKGPGFLFDPVAEVVAANERYAVISVIGGAPGVPVASLLLDSRTGRILWTDKGFDAFDLEKSVVVGATADGRIVGKSLSHDRQLWEQPPGVSARRWPQTPAHQWSDPIPGLTLLTTDHGRDNRLIDPSTGKTVRDLSGTGPATCVYDDQATAVCSGGGTDVTALDVPTARVLWRRPAGKPLAVTAAWHGVVYADAHGVPVTLDARTGRLLRSGTGASPDLVNGLYGLVLTDRGMAIHTAEPGNSPVPGRR